MATGTLYPVRVDGELDPQLSRWLWLAKWLLAIPHYVVLCFLWIAFIPMTVFAFFGILFTGRYPRAIFDFNVGVLRWTWRVAFYSYSALGTDHYPPFTLAEKPDYPATLEIAYPDHLSRGLVLVKWWLLALPHYLIVAVFAGGFGWATFQFGGLIGLLVLVAAVILLFSGTYPRSIFDFVLGLNRWVLRVVAYGALMTDAYPPFRLDMGAHESGAMAVATAPTARPRETAAWGPGRITGAVISTLVMLGSLGVLGVGIAGIVVDQTQRDAQGYLMTPTERFTTDTFAILSESVDVSLAGVPDWAFKDLVGSVKVTSDSDSPVFIGIARDSDIAAYLGDVRRAIVSDIKPDPTYDVRSGGAPAVPPADHAFWVATAAGSGTQSLTWELQDGTWAAVVMNADGSPAVTAELSVGAELDNLVWIAIGITAAGAALLLLGGAAFYWALPKNR